MPVWPADIALVFTMPPPGAVVPKTGTPLTSMPNPAEIVPPLLILAANIVPAKTAIPVLRATIDPVLVMPPPALPLPNATTLVTKMPALVPATILPPLLMPPSKVAAETTSMPLDPAEIVPELLMPPRKLVTGGRKKRPLPAPTLMPSLPAEIVPRLAIPPAKVDTLATWMPLPPAEIALVLVMPPPAVLPKTAVPLTATPAPVPAEIGRHC